MSRTLLRSGGDLQVEPDVLRHRRTTPQVSIGQSYEDAEASGAPLYPLEGVGSFWGKVPVKLELPSEENGREPRLVLGEGVWIRRPIGATTRPFPYKIISLFTHTSKMATISFSLAAGSPEWGGTCHAARTMPVWKDHPKDYICASCYALEGNYRYPNNIFFRAVRRQWTVEHLRADPSGQRLAGLLGDALESYARWSHHPTQKKGPIGSIRQSVELGVWDGRQVVVPGRTRARGVFAVPSPVTPLTGMAWGDTTTYLAQRPVVEADGRGGFRERAIQAGEVTGFFRMHDSGDFSIDPKPEVWDAYMRAWEIVCRRFPAVIFWVPTRLHFPGMELVLSKLAAMQAPCPNLVLRPSSLFVDRPAPMLEGFPAGSTVERREGSENSSAVDSEGHPCWACPAYPGGSRKALGSCRDHACRRCWIEGGTAVAYGHH